MFDPDFQKKEYKPVDSTTESIYKSKKFIYSLVSGSLERLNPSQKKYFEDIKLFIEGYESGMIRDWKKFFNGNFKHDLP